MSTEHQRYSIENQAAAIAAYARRRGYEIVATYLDEGVSGLRLKNRVGLQTLLADTVGGSPGFEAILVFDVSRWGRFQNPDQSAHYEFLCSEAGIRVEYCAEPFDNDGSLVAFLVKSLKRGMAAEFSRDLSAKVSAGKLRLCRKGYWQHGPPGLGLRRQTVDADGRPVAVLEAGERKAIQSHRVILAPGPAAEVALVNRIYHLFVDHRLTRRGIARLLNAEGQVTDRGRPWSFTTVHSVLTNPKYVGDLVFHRITTSLDGVRVRRPKSDWLRRPDAYAPIVARPLFDAAQEVIRTREVHMDTPAMVQALQALLRQHGRLTSAIIDAAPGTPCVTAFRRRFGTLRKAYAAAGYACRDPGLACANLSDEALLERLEQLLKTTGYLSAALVDRAQGLPSCTTYARRFGSIRNAFAMIGYVPMTARERESRVGKARAAAGFALLAAARKP